MINNEEFQKRLAFSRRSRFLQLITGPLKIFKYVFLTRLAFLIRKPIKGKAKLFFGRDIIGFFPEPVFSYLYLYGFSEESLTQSVSKYLKKGMTFLDVGSHVGYYSVLASKLVGEKGEVFAFEPTPSTYELLYSNVKKFNNVSAFPLAAWSQTQDLNFLDYGPFYAGVNSYTEARMSAEYLKKAAPDKLRVKAVSLDDFCQAFRLKPDFVKIDAESAELSVLKGMPTVIKNDKPIISIEIGDKKVHSKNGSLACIKFLEKLVYLAYDMEDGRTKRHKLRASYYLVYDNLLFLPKRGAK